MTTRKTRYRCRCGFLCYSPEQERYHREGVCLAIRRLLGVMTARERCGHGTHAGLRVGSLALSGLPGDACGPGFECTCHDAVGACPIHPRAA